MLLAFYEETRAKGQVAPFIAYKALQLGKARVINDAKFNYWLIDKLSHQQS